MINLKNPIEIRRAGINALVNALGPIGMAMFLKQYELGEGNYTKEKEELFLNLNEEDIEELILKHRDRN